ncbi:Protein patched/dispatched, partial [Trinorchestia longiramus]
LWLPQDSAFIKMLDWQNEHFPTHFRRQMLMWEAPNVLSAEAIREMWRLHLAITAAIEPKSGKTWSDLCARLPSLTVEETSADYDDYELGTLEFRRRRREAIEELDDISFALSRDSYCGALEDMPSFCYETSLLEIWGLNEDVIMSLTDEQVINDFNSATISNVFGFKTNFTSYVGDVKRDDTGKIVGAGAATHTWISKVDEAAVVAGDYRVDLASGQLVDSTNMDWEKIWLETVFNLRSNFTKVHANAASSFGDVSDSNIWGDVNFLILGFMLMFAFVNGTLGRRNKVEQRPLLSFIGLLSVGMAILSSYGICSAIGIKYSPVNSILPLLLIGLGVDDMFIITSVWDNDTQAHKRSENKELDDDLEAKAGRTMRHAGVAITATSLTDVTAFAIGATTQLPALQSFCAYASVGILIVFLLQASFFLVFLIYDERRLRQNRNGLLWCITHKDWKPSHCSQVDILNIAFAWYGRTIMKLRYVVLVITGILVVLSVVGTSLLKQEFNPNWFVPRDSYLADYFITHKTYFDNEGAQSFFFFANRSMSTTLPKLIEFNLELENADSVLNVHGWFNLFKTYVQLNGELTNRTWTEDFISEAVSLFLFTPTGGAYRNDIVFQGSIACNVSAPPMKYFRIPFKHRPADTPEQQQVATQEIHDLLARFSLPGYEGAWSEAYSIWETNSVVGEELLRNLILTGIVIMIMTNILLVSVRTACLVLLSVTGTVLGCAATMYITGFTIDTVSCISLVLSIGLSVDYSVHIAHTFLTEKSGGDRLDRVVQSLAHVGPAVLQGGVSSLIPFVMLAFSNSHVFVTFFIVFTPTTILGMYYALVLLPVLLSFIGPTPYESEDSPSVANGHVNQAFSQDISNISSEKIDS